MFYRKIFVIFIAISMLSSIFANKVDAATNESSFVTHIYESVLHRKPDINGLTYWLNMIKLKKTTGAYTVQAFIYSSEAKKSLESLNNKKYIALLYNAFLNRQPDLNGETYYLNKMNNGYSRHKVLCEIANSHEFKVICQKYGITPGSITLSDPMDTRPDLVKYVSKIYNILLGRNPDKAGLSYYVHILNSPKATVGSVVEGFISSPEFSNLNVNSNEYIRRLYKCLLNREPDNNGMSYWLGRLMDGYSRKFILAGFIGSSEFERVAKQFRLNGGKVIIDKNDIPYNGVKIGYTNASRLNVRQGPSTKSNIIETIDNKGIRVTIKNREPDFYHVTYISPENGKLREGYIYRIYVDVVTDDVQNSMLGNLSERYESSGDPGEISSGSNDPGGKSYGVWQLASQKGSVKSFMDWLYNKNRTYYNILNEAYNLDRGYGSNFDNAWRKLANNNYNEFYNLQQEYIKMQYYDNLIKRLLQIGNYDKYLNSFAIRNVLWSTAVQHGVYGAFNLIKGITGINNSINFINAIYDERSKVNIYFPSSKSLWDSLLDRFSNERNEALRVFNYELELNR